MPPANGSATITSPCENFNSLEKPIKSSGTEVIHAAIAPWHKTRVYNEGSNDRDAGLRPGSTDLVRRARAAQFVLIGEDHGFAEIPEFVIALKQTLGADVPPYLVAEIGPLSAALASVWGIDQEFILSTRMHFERLQVLAPPAGRATVQTYLTRAVEADRALIAEHNPSVMPLPQLSDADFRSLRNSFDVSGAAEAAEILKELAESADIYRGQSQDGYDSNRQRALLMKRHFMRYYREAEKRDGRAPRAMFRFGAFHAGRGLSPINQFEIGNLASELAASGGNESLHILVIVRSGHVNKWLPFPADTSSRSSTYDARTELAQIGAVPFLEHTLAGGAWTAFDMAPLRHSAANYPTG